MTKFTARLSVVVPATNQRGLVEQTLMSILTQPDPVGTEVIVVDNGSTDEVEDYLRGIFPEALAAERLRIQPFPREIWPGANQSRGASLAQGSFIAFASPGDVWRPGRLQWLEPLLFKNDLIIATAEDLPQSADWLNSFLSMNWAMPGSAVIRRTLFDEVGGFPRGLLAESEYKLWLACLSRLKKTERFDRFRLVRDQFLSPATRMPLPFPKFEEKVKRFKETVSLLQVSRKLPARYWPRVARKVFQSGKGLFKK